MYWTLNHMRLLQLTLWVVQNINFHNFNFTFTAYARAIKTVPFDRFICTDKIIRVLDTTLFLELYSFSEIYWKYHLTNCADKTIHVVVPKLFWLSSAWLWSENQNRLRTTVIDHIFEFVDFVDFVFHLKSAHVDSYYFYINAPFPFFLYIF